MTFIRLFQIKSHSKNRTVSLSSISSFVPTANCTGWIIFHFKLLHRRPFKSRNHGISRIIHIRPSHTPTLRLTAKANSSRRPDARLHIAVHFSFNVTSNEVETTTVYSFFPLPILIWAVSPLPFPGSGGSRKDMERVLAAIRLRHVGAISPPGAASRRRRRHHPSNEVDPPLRNVVVVVVGGLSRWFCLLGAVDRQRRHHPSM